MASTPATIPLCFQWTGGAATFLLNQDEALKVSVALRKLGLGLTYKKDQPMLTRATGKFTAAEDIIKAVRRGR